MRPVKCNTVIFFILLFCQSILISAAELPRALIITGNGNAVDHNYPYPPWIHEFHNDKVVEILNGIVTVDISDDLNSLNDSNLGRYDLLISNSLLLTPTQAQLDALHRFIGNGKAFLTLHAGLISFLNSEFHEEIIGGRYIGGPANEPEKFTVITHDEWWGYDYGFGDQTQHPVALASEDFLVHDELYYVQPNTGIDVIARAENHPVMWSKPWRKGKVMCLTLGHSLETKENPGYQTLLKNGVRWLTGYPMIGKIPDAEFENDTDLVESFIDLNQIAHHTNGSRLEFAVIENTNSKLVSAAVANRNRLRLDFSEGQTGAATIQIQARNAKGFTDTTQFQVFVSEKASGNLARYHGVTAVSSSNESRRISGNPLHVIDADSETRWSSDFEDPGWIYVDLGEPYRVDRVTLSWEGAFAKQYEIQVADTLENWHSVYTEKNGDGGMDEIRFEPVEARYVRMFGKQRALPAWGYSLYEFEVYGSP